MSHSTLKSLTILGCGGFIGSHLLKRILDTTDWHVYGIDIQCSKITELLDHPKFTFVELNVYDNERVREYVKKSDAVVSLVALCNPSLYNTIPLAVIEANYLRPYDLVKMCAEMDKWLIHYSTSEIYGRTIGSFLPEEHRGGDPSQYVIQEDTTPMLLGPIGAQRWTYACAKQLLERTMYAYKFEKGLRYSVVRPFNFIGPRMDFIPGVDGEGVPRVLACFMEALLYRRPLQLVDGGKNQRCFTYIEDAVDATMRILHNPEASTGQAFNVGNPKNEVSMKELAELMIELYKETRPDMSGCEFETRSVSSNDFYGEGYEDSDRRMPDIQKARTLLGWEPKTSLRDALKVTIQWYVDRYGKATACREAS